MAKSDNSSPKTSPGITCLLDTDVIINWLTKEEDTESDKILWEAPHKIMELIEGGKVKGLSTLVNLLEIRFVLRRKKNFAEDKIKEDVAKIIKLLEILVPDEVNLLKANGLQDDFPLSPFDAILLATALTSEGIFLISRDKALTSVASKFVKVVTPEVFLKDKLPSVLR